MKNISFPSYSHADICKYIRKRYHLTRADFATFCNVPESAIKRIEQSELPISLHIFLAMEELGLSNQILSSGIINLEEDLDRSAFPIAGQYFRDRFTGGKLINIFRAYYISRLGEKNWKEVLRRNGVDSLRFINENNSTSALLSHKIIQELTRQNAFGREELHNFASAVQRTIFKAPAPCYDKAEQIYYLDMFISKTKDFEQNTDWRIIDRFATTTYIEVVPREHMDIKNMFHNDRIAPGALEEWFKAMISGHGPSVEIKESLYKGDKRCLLKVS